MRSIVKYLQCNYEKEKHGGGILKKKRVKRKRSSPHYNKMCNEARKRKTLKKFINIII